ncbi:DNA cytosine methyltransferase [Fibrella forsythiae]|uniref:DNA (cytosine-5-)-methyltransferase n=1 Tax=Fibrella forsythiae TaxID=2817061 RepID=A0ABS3JF06_9BACT|nr:DNA cytosine methyltransferase [Fibrella forsythiae]MBO0947477.1 DNA cytosine methyltransferase [Fibrella forsythiae]
MSNRTIKKPVIVPELVRLIVVDSFCGAGGYTEGVEQACDRNGNRYAVVVAGINHDALAIASHIENHPETTHFVEDVRDKKLPRKVLAVVRQARKVYPNAKLLFHASLECTNFSNAKGGKPRDADSRSLAEFMPAYLSVLKPDIFTVENVREFMSWGPLDKNGKPEDRKRGKDFVKWYQGIEATGYRYDHRLHNTADFGANTSRTRYFAQFVKPDMPLAWPQPTHAKNPAKADMFAHPLKRWKPIRDCLQLDQKGQSIFRAKPLSDKTYERIFEGLIRHVGNGNRAFLTKYFTGTGMNYGVDQPASTITAVDHNALVSVEPFMARLFATASNNHGTYPASQPATTITTADGHAMVTPEPFISKYFSGRPQSKNYGIDEPGHCITTVDGQAIVSPQPFAMTYNSGSPENRVKSLDEPAQTLLTENTIALVSSEPFCIKYHSTGHNTFPADQPCSTLPTNDSVGIVQTEQFINLSYTQGKREQSIEEASAAITTVPKHQLVSALFIDQQYGKSKPVGIDAPSPCLTVNPHCALIEAFVADPQWGGHSHSLDAPGNTIIARQDKAPISLVQAEFITQRNGDELRNYPLDQPARTITTTGGNMELVSPQYVMNTNYTNVGSNLDEASKTITADRHWSYLMTAEKGLQPVILVFESDSIWVRRIKAFMAEYGIADILMRMLFVLELKLIQGFPANYVLKGSQTDQKKFIGNSVPPPYVKAWIEAICQAFDVEFAL